MLRFKWALRGSLLSEAGRKEERQSGSYSWSVLRSSAPYTQGVSMLGRILGELSHKGRARV